MTPREYCLARVLTRDQVRGALIMLKAADEDELSERYLFCERVLNTRPLLVPHGTNTREEAECVRCWKLGDDITVATSAYHQLRAFLTFVAVFKDTNTRIWNAPAPSRMDLLAEEFEKIKRYQRRGHVASYEEGMAYLQRRDAA